MPKIQEKIYFEPVEYINNLMYDLGFENASEKTRKEVYEELEQELNYVISNAVALYTEPEEMEEALIMYGDLKDFGEFMRKLIAMSPEAQEAIVKALDKFYEDMLANYKRAQERAKKTK